MVLRLRRMGKRLAKKGVEIPHNKSTNPAFHRYGKAYVG
jgi:hypothetical protein